MSYCIQEVSWYLWTQFFRDSSSRISRVLLQHIIFRIWNGLCSYFSCMWNMVFHQNNICNSFREKPCFWFDLLLRGCWLISFFRYSFWYSQTIQDLHSSGFIVWDFFLPSSSIFWKGWYTSPPKRHCARLKFGCKNIAFVCILIFLHGISGKVVTSPLVYFTTLIWFTRSGFYWFIFQGGSLTLLASP